MKVSVIKKMFLSVFLSLAFASVLNVAVAAPIVFTDRSAFNAATTGTTTVDFEGVGSATFRGAAYTVSGITFTGDIARMFTFDAGYYGPGLASDYLNMNEFGTHFIDISAAGMTAIGFDFGTLNRSFGTGAAVTVLDSLGNSYGLIAPDQPALGFIGFTSDTVLSSVRVTGELIVLDNVTTGSAAAAVPEPATLALLGLGLAGLGFQKRKRT